MYCRGQLDGLLTANIIISTCSTKNTKFYQKLLYDSSLKKTYCN